MTNEFLDFLEDKLLKICLSNLKLEGLNTTELATKNILDRITNGNVISLTFDEIGLLNTKRLWEEVLEFGSKEITLETFMWFNSILAYGIITNPGSIRETEVIITGTNYKPHIPSMAIIESRFDKYLQSNKELDDIIDLMLDFMKMQIFEDCNKRTAMFFANNILISRECGVLTFNDNVDTDEFLLLLKDFYETDDKQELIEFCKEKLYINFNRTELSSISFN